MKNRLEEFIGDFDPSLPVPQIDPVTEGIRRPLWSVMIPTFNCAKYLEKTLVSVLCQDLGPEKMQIEVIDDCSTKDDPGAVTRKIGKGRVKFYKNPKNSGSCSKNFNICLERSQGQLIHILHGDDYVHKNFYSTISCMAKTHPKCSFYGTRCFFVNKDNVILGVSPLIKNLKNPTNNNTDFFYNTVVQASGAVVRRSFYEKYGGFNENLNHVADCEMWARTIFLGSGIVSEKVLSFYRVFEGNQTSKKVANGDNIKEYEKLNQIFFKKYKKFSFKCADKILTKKLVTQIKILQRQNNKKGALENLLILKKLKPLIYYQQKILNFFKKIKKFYKK